MQRFTWRERLDFILTISMALIIALLGWRLYSHEDVAPSRPQEFAVPTDPVSLNNAYVRGNPNAPVLVLMYADFECSACRLFEEEAFPVLDEQYIQTGGVALAFQPFPLRSRGEAAIQEAALARCAGRYGRFWEAHAALFRNTGRVIAEKRDAVADAASLESATLEACIQEEARAVRQSMAEAERIGVVGTPSFLIGSLDESKRLKATMAHRGVGRGSKCWWICSSPSSTAHHDERIAAAIAPRE